MTDVELRHALRAGDRLYGTLIVWYDNRFQMQNTGLSGLVAKVGAASYSIYLLHFFVVFKGARFIDSQIVPLNDFYSVMGVGMMCFIPMAVIGWYSFEYFETYWLKFRKPYASKSTSSLPLASEAAISQIR